MVSRADGPGERLDKCSRRTTDMYVSLMYVSLMYVSLSRLTLAFGNVSLERLTYFNSRQFLSSSKKQVARLL